MQESNVWCAVSFFLLAVIDIQLFVIYVLLKERQCRNGACRNEPAGDTERSRDD